MWTKMHRARHDARLKGMVSTYAVAEIARWLERADPPRSKRRTPLLPVVGAIAWHLRTGGGWRALLTGWPPWRTVYGWFRRWLERGLFDRLMRVVACLRRCAAGCRSGPHLAILDTQSVKCLPVRGPRGFDAAKKVLGRKRVALVDADGTWLAVAVVPANVPDRDCLEALTSGKQACARRFWTAPSSRNAARSGATSTACAAAWLSAILPRRASSSLNGAGWWSAASAGWCTGGDCCGTAPAAWTSPPRVSPSPPSCPASRL